MKNITLEQLLEAGCHFGHQVTRGNPRARDFIFEERDGIHIIDLAKTKEGLDEAAAFVSALGSKENTSIVIVGTKRQAREILGKEIERVKSELGENSNFYYVTNKWIGGLLTNFSEVSKNFKKLTDLSHKLVTPSEQEGFTKKEIGDWAKAKEKLEGFYGGVYKLKQVPDALFIIDSHLENLAVSEAMRMGVPTIAITDTNSDPNLIDYPIPANDDAVGSLQLIISHIFDAWVEGKKKIKNDKSNLKSEKETEEAKGSKSAVEPKSEKKSRIVKAENKTAKTSKVKK